MKGLILTMTIGIFLSCQKNAGSDPASLNSTPIAASEVVDTVIQQFQSRYPNASGEIQWEREDGGTYKVKFFQGTARWEARFGADGRFLGEKLLVPGEPVPQAVLDAFASQFPNAGVPKWSKQNNQWKAEFLLNGRKWEASFDLSGQLLKSEAAG